MAAQLSALFGTNLSQHARLITLATAQDSDLPESLMAERFAVREAVNELFCFEVDAFTVSTDLELDQFLGEEITLKLLLADGSRRAWHGICTDAAWVGADGGVARYRLRLEPALHLIRERRDCYIFQDKNVREIATELLADYPQVRFEFEIAQQLASRAICTQYRESDFDFLRRILASEGLNWRFEHEQSDISLTSQAKHKLVIFDSKAAAPDMPGDAASRFHGVRATDMHDAIDQFAAVRRIQPNAVTSSSWHPEQLFAPGAERASSLDAGGLPSLPLHDGSGERRYAVGAAAQLHSELVLQAFEMENKQFAGAGAVRALAPGHAFDLTPHDRFGDEHHTVLWVAHEARNNFEPALASAGAKRLENGTYRNSFGCVRDAVAIVPTAITARGCERAIGSQTALVVGLPGAIATTGRDHQVKIQFSVAARSCAQFRRRRPQHRPARQRTWKRNFGCLGARFGNVGRPEPGLAIHAAHRHRRAGRLHRRRHRPARDRLAALHRQRRVAPTRPASIRAPITPGSCPESTAITSTAAATTTGKSTTRPRS